MTDTTLTDSRTSDDPATIERDIRHTQNEMSQTVDKLGDQLTLKNVFNALLDKADENGVDAHYLLDGARRNPIALGMIAAGAIWLISDKNSKFPSMPGGSSGSGSNEFGSDTSDIHHSNYVSHMSSLEMRDGEDPTSYQRRRDLHRASFLMCERKLDEDEGSFRQRLDDLTNSFREKRRAWSDSISEAGSSATDSAGQAARSAGHTARRAASRAQDLYDSNPLIGGMLAAAVGAAVGSGIPISRKERETLGDLGSEARDMVSEQKNELTHKVMEKKDELLDKAEEKLKPASGSQQGQQGQQRKQAGPAASAASQSKPAGSDEPFIISEGRS